MKYRKTLISFIWLLVAILSLMAMIPGSSAFYFTRDRVIGANNYYGMGSSIYFGSGAILATWKVVSGPGIDVFVLPDADYLVWKNDKVKDPQNCLVLKKNTTIGSLNQQLNYFSYYWIMFSNINGSQDATVEIEMLWWPLPMGPEITAIISLVSLFILASCGTAILSIIIIIRRRRKKR